MVSLMSFSKPFQRAGFDIAGWDETGHLGLERGLTVSGRWWLGEGKPKKGQLVMGEGWKKAKDEFCPFCSFICSTNIYWESILLIEKHFFKDWGRKKITPCGSLGVWGGDRQPRQHVVTAEYRKCHKIGGHTARWGPRGRMYGGRDDRGPSQRHGCLNLVLKGKETCLPGGLQRGWTLYAER